MRLSDNGHNNSMARPKLEIDPKLVERLASIQCTNEEIAAACGCSADTIELRFTGELEKGRARGKRSLRRLQYKRAKAGSDTMLIWLGKNVLGQKDRSEVEHVVSVEYTNELEEARKRVATSQVTAH